MNDQPERSEAFHKRCANLMSAVPQAEVAELRKDTERLKMLLGELIDHATIYSDVEASEVGRELIARCRRNIE